MKAIRMLAAGMFITFAASPAPGQTDGGIPLVRASLISGHRDGRWPMTVAVRLRIANGWHVYWKNPGDTGLAVDVKWTLPPGYTAGPLQFPTPRKHVTEESATYVLSDDVILLTEITPPATGASYSVPIRAHVDWLVCRDRCLRGDTVLSIDPSDQTPAQSVVVARTIDSARLRMPKMNLPDGVGVSIEDPVDTRDSLRFTLVFDAPGRGGAIDFFPYADDHLAISYRSIAVTGNHVHLAFAKTAPDYFPSTLSGIVTIGGEGYEVLLGLSRPAPNPGGHR